MTESATYSVLLSGDLKTGFEPAQVVDATGAGDMFAAGFLHGLAQGREPEVCARIGSVAAGEIISHMGARPEADLKALVAGVGL